MSYVFSWKIPKYPSVSAQEAGEHIKELEEQHGEVTPKILLDDSRPEEAILHPCYEWDDFKAAEKYRLYQSKQIIGNLVTVRIDEAEEPLRKPVRVFVQTKDRNESASYVSIGKALSNEETRNRVIANAKQELRMFECKYRALVDVAAVLKEFAEELESS